MLMMVMLGGGRRGDDDDENSSSRLEEVGVEQRTMQQKWNQCN